MGTSTDRRRQHNSRRGGGHRAAPELAQPGDWIEVEGTRGAGPRRGEILAVLGSPDHTHFRVRWDEKHESLLYPADGGCIVHAGKPHGPR